MPRKIRRSSPQSANLDAEVSEYLLARSMLERATWQTSKWKAQFMELLAGSGTLQEGGHRVLRLNEPVLFSSYSTTGKMTEKEIVGIRRVRRESQSLNPERVMALLEAKGMVEACTVTRRDIDEDAVLAANFEGTITDEEMDALWDKGENFAFYLVEE